jgi:hypothetical protein
VMWKILLASPKLADQIRGCQSRGGRRATRSPVLVQCIEALEGKRYAA